MIYIAKVLKEGRFTLWELFLCSLTVSAILYENILQIFALDDKYLILGHLRVSPAAQSRGRNAADASVDHTLSIPFLGPCIIARHCL